MNTYKVVAKKWSEGWELDIVGEGVTQVRTLDKAVAQVRDYLETLHDTDFSEANVELLPDLDGLEQEIAVARQATIEAAEAQVRAADRFRHVAAMLRTKGLSVTDLATVLDVSRGRVSQLLAARDDTRAPNKIAVITTSTGEEVRMMGKGDIDTYYEDGTWKNKVEGGKRASSTHDTKAEAEKAGRAMARDREVEHVIKNKNGQIGKGGSSKNSYGPDSPKTPG